MLKVSNFYCIDIIANMVNILMQYFKNQNKCQEVHDEKISKF